jgi:hypothetical protein
MSMKGFKNWTEEGVMFNERLDKLEAKEREWEKILSILIESNKRLTELIKTLES